jgi:hypothetical protein
MNKLRIGLTTIAAFALLASCEAVFTFSPLEGLARDPSQLSPQQKVEYAQEALASGDTAAMKKAYDAIKGSKDPSTNVLAGELAFGASGASGALTKALAVIAGGGDESSLDSILDSVDLSLATAGAQNIVSADAGGADVTDSQYAIAASAYALSAANAAGGFENFPLSSGDPGYADYEQAQQLADKVSSSDLSSALQSIL